jgi:hypothetical protein
MQTQIVLREIAAAPSNFANLLDATRVNGNLRADRSTVAAGSYQSKKYAMKRILV